MGPLHEKGIGQSKGFVMVPLLNHAFDDVPGRSGRCVRIHCQAISKLFATGSFFLYGRSDDRSMMGPILDATSSHARACFFDKFSPCLSSLSCSAATSPKWGA